MDVALEGCASKVSRQQAKLELKRDGCFYLRNHGARPLYINSTKLDKVRWRSRLAQHSLALSNVIPALAYGLVL